MLLDVSYCNANLLIGNKMLLDKNTITPTESSTVIQKYMDLCFSHSLRGPNRNYRVF